MDKLTIQEFGATIKQKYPQYSGFSDYEIGQKTLKKYPQYGQKVITTFDVEDVKPTKEQNLANTQQQAAQYKAEAEKVAPKLGGLNTIKGAVKAVLNPKAAAVNLAKNNAGFLGNYSKAVVENLAPSEVGLGKSLSKVSNKNRETYTKIIQDTNNQQANLLKSIKEKEAKGGDATSLKRIYNQNVQQLREVNKNLEEENNIPSNQKVAGQLAGTAVDILTAGTGSKTAGMKTGQLTKGSTGTVSKIATATGLPELGTLANQKAGGLFTKKGLGNITKGASIGYASDISMGLQGLRGENREGGNAFIPGLSTAIGTGIPVISEAGQTIVNRTDPELKAQRLITKRSKALDKLDKYQTIKKATEKGNQRGIDIKKLLAETDVLSGTVDNTGNITTKGEDGAIAQYTKQYIDGNEGIVSDLLKKENRSISPSLVKARLIQQVKSAGIEGKNLTSALKSIDDEIAGYMLRADEQGNIPVSIIHDAKIDKYNGINFFTEGATKKYDKTIAQGLKELVEETTTSADIKKINQELSKHFAVIDYLNKLDNKKVDGGKLGKYFAQTVGAIVGGKLGPLGAMAGAEVGGMTKGGLMARTFNGKTGKIPQQSEVITEALKVKNASPLELNQSKSNNLGNLKINQSTTITPTMSDIPKVSNETSGKSSTLSTTINKLKKTLTPKDSQSGFVSIGGYKGEKDLTTKILKDLEGKTTVSKQYILDATNRGELKQVERDLIRDMVQNEGDVVNVADFAKKVKAELLPLKVSKARDMYSTARGGTGGRYENIALPDDLRGSVKNYEERIYESPIKTSAGDVHFGQPKDKVEGYFGHTRIEDMADNKTRRVIEVQSDLYQKGNLGKEIDSQTVKDLSISYKGGDIWEVVDSKGKSLEQFGGKGIGANKARSMAEDFVLKNTKQGEISKLQQYNDPTAHFRMIREEIKKASQDGKTKLQFPTGETAMKIEGLVGEELLFNTDEIISKDAGAVIIDRSGESFVIVNNHKAIKQIDYLSEQHLKDLIDNRNFERAFWDEENFEFFKKNVAEKDYKDAIEIINVDQASYDLSEFLQTEVFDYMKSDKVDTNNPIYKFYEKEVAKYLNKFGGKRVVDDKGVSWIEIPITKEQGKAPVEAFGKLKSGLLFPVAGASAAGVLGASYIKSKKEKK